MNVDMTISLNINDMVEVFLTPQGERILKKFESTVGAEIPRRPDSALRCNLWNLMQIFGLDIFPGVSNPFLNDQILIVEELK